MRMHFRGLSGRARGRYGAQRGGIWVTVGCLSAALHGLTWAAWTTEGVDSPILIDSITDRSLQFDQQGLPHVAFGGDHLYYAWHNGDVWVVEVADTGRQVGRCAAIALDRQGRPHISYYDCGTDSLRYAYKDRSGWHSYALDQALADYNCTTSIAVDARGHPHIVYHEYGRFVLKYAVLDGPDWRLECVDTCGIYIGSCAIALDADGFPRVAYSGGGLRLARRDSTSWHVDLVGQGGSASSLTVDGDGFAHISHSGDEMWYTYQDPSGWHYEVIAHVSGNSSIALSLDGTVCVAFEDRGGLRYAVRADTEWVVETPEPATGYVDKVSLALEGTGIPHIVYLDSHTQYLRRDELSHIAWDGVQWTAELITQEGSVGQYNSLAIDASGVAHISYFDWSNCDLKYARQTGGGWFLQSVDVQGDVGDHTSIAVDSNGNPRISYLAQTASWIWLLRVASWDGAAWVIETVDSRPQGGIVGRYSSLALDAADRPHVAYLDFDLFGGMDYNLRYATDDGTGWVVEVVAEQGYAGAEASLRLDSQGRPHVSYADQGGVGYAWRTSSGWQVTHVDAFEDAVIEAGMGGCLALDSEGRPHISCCAQRNTPAQWAPEYELRYGWFDGSSWHVETVASWEGDYCHTSLQIDGEGRPHISYAHGWQGELRVVWKQGEIWNFERVADGISHGLGLRNPLVIANDGSRYLSYYDAPMHDLRFASSAQPTSTEDGTLPGSRSLALSVLGGTPSRGAVFLRIISPDGSPKSLGISDLLGRRIRSLNCGMSSKGVSVISWDGFDDRGLRVPSGTYICSAEAGGARASTRVVVIR